MVKQVRAVIALLEANGWVYSHTKGDHRIFKKKGERPIPVSGALSDDVPVGTLKSILRSAKLTETSFNEI